MKSISKSKIINFYFKALCEATFPPSKQPPTTLSIAGLIVFPQ